MADERPTIRLCPCCEGQACEECDGTGQRVTTILDFDGVPVRVSGTNPLTVESVAALGEVLRAAMKQMDKRTENK